MDFRINYNCKGLGKREPRKLQKYVTIHTYYTQSPIIRNGLIRLDDLIVINLYEFRELSCPRWWGKKVNRRIQTTDPNHCHHPLITQLRAKIEQVCTVPVKGLKILWTQRNRSLITILFYFSTFSLSQCNLIIITQDSRILHMNKVYATIIFILFNVLSY